MTPVRNKNRGYHYKMRWFEVVQGKLKLRIYIEAFLSTTIFSGFYFFLHLFFHLSYLSLL